MIEFRKAPATETWADFAIEVPRLMLLHIKCLNLLTESYYLGLTLYSLPSMVELRRLKRTWDKHTKGTHFTIYANTPRNIKFAEFFGFKCSYSMPEYEVLERQG